ncbi:MAG: hypothetical protein ACC707_08585 [Thiohalomonadales bacterium]
MVCQQTKRRQKYMPLYLNSASLADISKAISEASEVVMLAFNSQQSSEEADAVKPNMITTALRQLIDIMAMIEVDQATDIAYSDTLATFPKEPLSEIDMSPLSRTEISEIGDHGMSLVQTLSEWAENLALGMQQQQLHAVMVILALWIARHGGYIRNLDTVVDTLADIANKTSDAKILAELSHVMGEIIDAVDMNNRNINDSIRGSRTQSWKILNINRGIIATRTHDASIMEPVFEQLVHNIPEYAPIFFEKGIREVDTPNYPADTQSMMIRFYQKFHSHTLH